MGADTQAFLPERGGNLSVTVPIWLALHDCPLDRWKISVNNRRTQKILRPRLGRRSPCLRLPHGRLTHRSWLGTSRNSHVSAAGASGRVTPRQVASPDPYPGWSAR